MFKEREILMKEKYIDLHTHSVYSDGEFTPLELIKMSRENNIGTLAITDHNRVDAYKSFDYKQDCGLKIVTGCELSALVSKGQMHILGLGINPYNEELNYELDKLKEVSLNSVSAIIRQIDKDYGIKLPIKDVDELLSSTHNIGRPDIAKLLIKYGYVKNVGEAFDKYLVDAYNKTREYRKLLTYKRCIEVINESNGIPVLAHPKSLKLNNKELYVLLKEMINVGLKGIEAYHSSHEKVEMEIYNEMAKDLNLLVSGGSDYHGPIVKPDIELGSGRKDNLNIKRLTIMNYL